MRMYVHYHLPNNHFSVSKENKINVMDWICYLEDYSFAQLSIWYWKAGVAGYLKYEIHEKHWDSKTCMGQTLVLIFDAYYNEPVANSQYFTQSLQVCQVTYFIIEISNFKNVLNICYSICHAQVSLGITQQYYITVVF